MISFRYSWFLFFATFAWLILTSASCGSRGNGQETDRIRPWPGNPHYLAWGNTPVFLIGPTGYHGWTPISRPGEMDFHKQLHRLDKVIRDAGSMHVCGFVRCIPYDPMNHMHDGEVSEVLQPWKRLDDGRYDLERFEEAWGKRLKVFLDLAHDLRIVVSIEVWDDWSVTRGVGGAWNAHPFNPRNIVNFDSTVLSATTSECNAPFYSTIPARKNIPEVLELQKRYVDHLISIISEYPNVLINISNESRADLDWSRFWAGYIRKAVNGKIMIGEMPSTNRVDGGGECEYDFNPLTLSTDPSYDYVDIAQGVSGHEFGGDPFRQAIEGSRRILGYRMAMDKSGTSRPFIVSKDYTRGPDGGTIVLWSRFAGGTASARFHRPAGDHDPSVIDFQHETALRLARFVAGVPFWQMYPLHDAVESLPEGAGANVLAEADSHYVVQLIGGAEGKHLGLSLPNGTWSVTWSDPSTGETLVQYEVPADSGTVYLEIPGNLDHHIIQIVKVH